MKCDKKAMLLYAVTDRAWVGRQSLYEQVESALKGGATCVQLREKELDDEAFLNEAVEISALCRRYGVPFFINDNVEIAIRCHADGIHVGQLHIGLRQCLRYYLIYPLGVFSGCYLGNHSPVKGMYVYL